ncbi:MAG: penicillin-binding protein 1C [Bdellovibrionota bacterium]
MKLLLKNSLFIVFIFHLSFSAWGEFPSFEQVKSNLAESEYRLYDRHAQLIHVQRMNLKVRQIGWTPLANISPVLLDAVIKSEDKRFYAHRGVDWLALSAATFSHFFRSSQRGASTISMQVVSFLEKKLKPKGTKRSFAQKKEQISAALDLEKSWSKAQILEVYLNLVYFRGELQGVASASQGLFNKDPSGLNKDESAILAALIRSPQASLQKAGERACEVLKKLNSLERCFLVKKLIETQGLFPRPISPVVALAPHVARILMEKNIHQTSLDRNIQQNVFNILRSQVLSKQDHNMNDAAALVVDNKTGQVVAYVGSVGGLSSANEVDGVRAFRQAGSTLKPFLYSIALEQKYLTPSSLVDDSSADISLGPGSVYHPQDFDREYHGDNVTLREALGSSLNIPAVKTLQMIGVAKLVERMNQLGFQNLKSEEYYGPSLALGTADVSLWNLVNAYRTFANEGKWSELSLSPVEEKNIKFKHVISPQSSFLIGNILSDKMNRSLTFGLNSPMSLPFWTAVKTGTSKDMRDNWCVGFSSRYTVGVWTGNFSGEPMWNVTGVSGAAPAWAQIMEVLHERNKDLSPKPPRGVLSKNGEWYIHGTEPNEDLPLLLGTKSQHVIPKIIYPVEGMMIAVDPDIPAEQQRIFFESSVQDDSLKWVLNDDEIADNSEKYPWQPSIKGSYNLKLISTKGKLIDEVHFFVR